MINKQDPTFSPSKLTDAPAAPAGSGPSVAEQTPASVNASAISTGGTGFGMMPDFSSNPGLLGDLAQAMQNYTYSWPAQGYISNADARNANSYYNKFGAGGGGDPRANQVMERLYGAVGELPTRPVETGALAKLYNSGAAERGPATGRPYNETLREIMSGPGAEAARDAGFTDQYRGFWQFGHRLPYYNEWGQYHPPPGGGY